MLLQAETLPRRLHLPEGERAAMKYTGDLIAAPFRKPHFLHQMKEFEAHAGTAARGLLWTMRTGKSKAVVDKACFLYTTGQIDGVLVFAPNGVHANWIDRELSLHAWPGIECDALVWRSQVAGSKAVNKLAWGDVDAWAVAQAKWWDKLKDIRKSPNLFWLAINTESMTRDDVRRAVKRFVKHRKVMVVFDESDDFGTPSSKRTHMARAVARRASYRVILSGTSATGSPLALWSQFELLAPGALGFAKYSDFEAHYAEYELAKTRAGRQYKRLVRYVRLDDLQRRIAPYCSVVTRDEVKDMPDLVYEERPIDLSPEQRAVYKQLLRSFYIELADGVQLSVGERAQRLTKLQQVCSGFVIDENGVTHDIPGRNPRLEALLREVLTCPGKVIVWCQFQRDIDKVTKLLCTSGIKAVGYHGRVSGVDKSNALSSFQNDAGTGAIVGHIQSGGRGLTMTAAHRIINYSHTFKARLRVQSEERATEIGGRNILVVDLVAPGPDRYILDTTKNRRDIADTLAGTGLRDLLNSVAL
ncbi:helicase-related protein [Rhodopseudomonas palustris]